MRIYAMAYCLIGCCLGCNLFKNSSKTRMEDTALSSTDTRLNITSDFSSDRSSGMLSFKRDSGSRDYTVQVWPLGNFSYSPERGFEGQAKKIQITGRDHHVAASADLSGTRDLSKQKTQMKLNQNRQTKAKSVVTATERSPSWKWIIVTAAVLIIMLIWRFRIRLF